MNIKDRLRHIAQDSFIKNNTIYFFGSLTVAFLNYLYYPIVARLVNVSSFGEIQTIFSLIAQIGIVLSVLGIAITNIIANSSNQDEKIDVVILIERIAIIASFAIFVVFAIASFWLKGFFQFSSAYPFIAFALALALNIPLMIRNAFIQGINDFSTLSLSNIINALAKIVFSFILIYIGLKTTGAIFGLALAQVSALIYIYIQTKNSLKPTPALASHDAQYKKNIQQQLRNETKYLLFVFVIFISITLVYTSDVLIVKHLFSPFTAGLYASISSVARIIYYATASVSAVLIPAVTLKATNKANVQILLKALGIIFVIGGGGLVLFCLFPKIIILILMGRKFLPYTNLLPRLSIAIFLISLVNLLFSYFIALRKYFVTIIAFFGIAIGILVLHYNHSSLISIINTLIITNMFFLVCLTIYLLQSMFHFLPLETKTGIIPDSIIT